MVRLTPLLLFSIALPAIPLVSSEAQPATITEELTEYTTYPFSDPNPIPEVNRIYPYFRFDGYTNGSIQQQWKMVILENEYIKVYVCPEIGGKIWGAIEKSTGKDFLYYNHVVKFRDVAMRGPWTAGGLEFNFGDIGHIPTCATPVDYTTRKYPDGSVSCVVGATDLPSGTRWNVEIRVSPGDAFFRTRASWFNGTELPCTYYHWMNAAARAGDDLEFIYPGNRWIGHGEETGDWPVDNGREVNWYRNNDFGSYKSYHVVNAYTDFFGGYWHGEQFGFGHYSNYDEKPGKKLWIWGLAPEGMIWEDLLTDDDGQYIEYQAGKLFNQAAYGSSDTPFKHKEFPPHDADIMDEIWFPLVGTGGMVAVSEKLVLNVVEEEGQWKILLSALQAVDDELMIYKNGALLATCPIKLEPLELFETRVETKPGEEMSIELARDPLRYSSDPEDRLVNRPLKMDEHFSWESAYGLFTRGLELEKQREYLSAKKAYEQALEKDPGFIPALNRLAAGHYRQMNYGDALGLLLRSLSIDSYDGEANYLLGLVSRETGDLATSKSGFSIAMGDVAYRSAAATELAILFLREKQWAKALHYSGKANAFNQFNMEALRVMAVAHRKTGNPEAAGESISRMAELDGTDHFSMFESYLLSGETMDLERFKAGMNGELPYETCLDLAIGYYRKGCPAEAGQVLGSAPGHPVVNLWLAHLYPDQYQVYMDRVLDHPVESVFPHRIETAIILKSALERHPHWKLHYYLGLILWNKGLLEDAREQFDACGDIPGSATFYMAKSILSESPEEQSDCVRKAVEIEPRNWRASLALARIYLADNQPGEAFRLLEPLIGTHPEHSSIGLFYARSLTDMGEYEKALSFLEHYVLLPSEGATFGRILYHEICIRSAAASLIRGKHKRAILLAEKAKRWPENLGVGRPYDVDERLADFILTLAYHAGGDEETASDCARRIMEYRHPGYRPENSKLFLQLEMLDRAGRKEVAGRLVSHFLEEDPDNDYIRWVEARYRGNPEASEIGKRILTGSRTVMAYGTQFEDEEFELLMEILDVLDTHRSWEQSVE